MRVVRTIAGVLLLTVGLTVLLVGSALWMVADQRDAGGAFTASMQRISTPGRAIVVPDLDALLRRDAPFTRTGQARLRITAGTEARPAFLGLAPTADAGRYLAAMPYAQVDRVAVTRGRLPVQVTPVTRVAAPSDVAVATPGEQAFWVRQAARTLDLDPDDLRGQRLSLVVMYPDAGPSVALDLRAELRVGWLEPTTWGLLAGGALFALLGVAVLVWPSRPREVVFVVEPSQLPVLTARLGVRALDNLGLPAGGATRSRRPARPPAPAVPTPAVPASAVPASAPPGWPTHSNVPVPSRPVDTSRARAVNGLPTRRPGLLPARPETLADVLGQQDPNPAGGDPSITTHDDVPANGLPANGGSPNGTTATETTVTGGSLDHVWPASSPPPAKLVLNWPPRAAGTTGPMSKQPVNPAPAYPTKTAPVRSADFQPTDPASTQPKTAQPEVAHPETVQPEAVQPEPAPVAYGQSGEALDPVHARTGRITNPVPAYPGKGMASGVPVEDVGPASKPAAARSTSTRRGKAGATVENAATTRSKKCKPMPDDGSEPAAGSGSDVEGTADAAKAAPAR